ncbi:hypothetical protein BsWGS_14861 [Bradybaena similaris]
MGAACASGLTVFSSNIKDQPVKILIVGRPSTGKTFLLYSWKYGVDAILTVEPTEHFNVDTITTQSGRKILVYDLAGNIGLRMRPFLEGTNGLVYMLGLYGRDDFLQEEEMEFLQQLIQERDLANAPFLFVIRKEGDENEPHQDLLDRLQQCLKERVWDLVEIRSRNQEDANLVLTVLEDLLNNTTNAES